VAVVIPVTVTGVVLHGTAPAPHDSGPVLVPLPSWPRELAPQHRTVPSVRSAQVYSCPAVTVLAVVIPVTETGVVLHGRLRQVSGPVLVPLPSWPATFLPQHFTVPSDRTAQVWKLSESATSVAVVIPLTATGVVLHAGG
jgi:hypothetical protein